MAANSLENCPIHRSITDWFGAYPSQQPLLVAVSGGIDSMVLLDALLHQANVKIQALHFHHGNVFSNSNDAMRACCVAQCAQRGIECSVVDLDVTTLGSKETAARNARRQALATLLAAQQYALLAHHSDDQLETLLLRLGRGTGTFGMQGIQPRSAIGRGWIGRPLLAVTKQHIHQYAREHGIEHYEDPSNADDGFDRNYIRKHIGQPLLQRWPKSNLAAQQCAAQTQQWFAIIDTVIDKMMMPGAAAISSAALAAFSKVQQGMLLAQWFANTVAQQGLYHHIQRQQRHSMMARYSSVGSGFKELYAWDNWRLYRYQAAVYCVVLPEVQPIEHGRHRQQLGWGTLQVSTSAWQIITDSNYSIRYRQHGDCWADSRKPINKRMQQHVLPWMRAGWPIICNHHHVVAIIGLPTKLQSNTLHLSNKLEKVLADISWDTNTNIANA